MIRSILKPALTLLFSAIALAPNLAQAQVPGDLAGKWKTTQAGVSKTFTAVWEFKGDRFTLEMTRSDGRKVSVEGQIAFNDQKTPKTFDIKTASATIDSKPVTMPPQEGIYSIDANKTLTLRMAAKRPTALDGPEAEKDPTWMKLIRVDD